MMKVTKYVLLLLIFAASSNANIVAQVGKHIITYKDITDRYDSLHAAHKNFPNFGVVKSDILESLIDEKIYELEAQKYGITLDENDYKNQIEQAKEMPFYHKHAKQIDSQIKATILWHKIIKLIIYPEVQTSKFEVDLESLFLINKNSNQNYDFTLQKISISKEKFDTYLEQIIEQKEKINKCADGKKFIENFGLNKDEQITINSSSINKDLEHELLNINIGQTTKIGDFNGVYQFFILCKKNKKDIAHIYLTSEEVLDNKIYLAAKNYLNKIKKTIYIKYNCNEYSFAQKCN